MKAKTFLKLTAAAAAMTGAACAAAGNYFVENFLSQKGIERLTHKTMLSEEEHSCRVVVPNNQLSLAIGNKGQNARLAAKLTGWKIDINPETEEPVINFDE